MTEQAIDNARDVRKGEELDVATLTPYLNEHIEEFGSQLSIKQFRSGHSNLTYLIEDGAHPSGFVLRRPPFGAQVKSGHDMSREYNVMAHLYPHWPKVPKPYVLCEDDDVLGAPFYVMERVVGVILRGSDPKGVDLGEQNMARVCDAFIDTLVEIHALDINEVGLADFGKPEGYIERQITGWTRRWHKAKTDEVEVIEEVAAWLAQNMPEDGAPAVIHNDFKYDNLVLDPDDLSKVRAVLDWEMATIGDPLMDLGSALAYWVEPTDSFVLQQLRFGPTTKPGNLTRQQLVDRYADRSGRDVSNFLFYYVYGLFKVAVVAQQIYYRYKHGFTQDQRFAGLLFAVQALGEAASQAIESGKISADG